MFRAEKWFVNRLIRSCGPERTSGHQTTSDHTAFGVKGDATTQRRMIPGLSPHIEPLFYNVSTLR